MTPKDGARDPRVGRYFSIENRGIRHRLFQASSWLRYYRFYGDFERVVMGVSREDCKRLAKANLYMAHRLNREGNIHDAH